MTLTTATNAQTAPKIDLIIDTDPGADDVVALLFALASPDELNVRALTTVAGNVRLDKTSRNARLAREWAGREEVPVYAGAPRPLMRTPIYAEDRPWAARGAVSSEDVDGTESSQHAQGRRYAIVVLLSSQRPERSRTP